MVLASAFIFTSRTALGLALTLLLCIALVAAVRRPRISRTGQALIAGGLLLLTLAAGGLTWQRPHEREVAVMVDLSASTRTAHYRNVDTLHRRISQLLGSTPYRLIYFAAENHQAVAAGPELPDLAGQRTVFSPPDAAAVVLFSDVQFDLPATAPPTYIVVDPFLEDPPDAAINRLELRGQSVATAITNTSGQSRQLRLSNGTTDAASTVAPGSFVVAHPLTDNPAAISARLAGQDPWPENDQLSMRIPPPALGQRWWMGPDAPNGWRSLDRLPLESTQYLAPAIIALNNIAATDLTEAELQLLHQYVRDLGGSLLILGGDRSFAAGAYQGTLLDSLSPLASSPPMPTLHWILLADSSGSMDAREGNTTRWALATQALLQLLPHLPPEDPVTIGSFAQDLRWWSQGGNARQTAAMPLPPPGIAPIGPTNLQPALITIISQANDRLPKELLLLSDADTEITDPDQLQAGLQQKKIRLHLLLIGSQGQGRVLLEQLAKATGGQVLQELDPRRWTQATHQLFRKVWPDHLHREPQTVRFTSDIAQLPDRALTLWNQVWLKSSPRQAKLLATTASLDARTPLVAQWQVGAGQVLAAAFPAAGAEVAAFADRIAHPPRDPRFQVTWETGSNLRVSVDAVHGGVFLNEQNLVLDLLPDGSDASPASHLIPQVAPGRYELILPAPRHPAFVTVRHDGRTLDRTAIAGRYAPEFNVIGNHHRAMRELARRSGGAIVPPAQTKPIGFPWPRHSISLLSPLAACGSLLIAAGLLISARAGRHAEERAVDFASRR